MVSYVASKPHLAYYVTLLIIASCCLHSPRIKQWLPVVTYGCGNLAQTELDSKENFKVYSLWKQTRVKTGTGTESGLRVSGEVCI